MKTNPDFANAIVAEFKAEWATMATANGNKRHGCEMRYRRRLERECGFDRNQAFRAVWDAKGEVVS